MHWCLSLHLALRQLRQRKKGNAACVWFYSGQREICIPLQINFCLGWELRKGSKQRKQISSRQPKESKPLPCKHSWKLWLVCHTKLWLRGSIWDLQQVDSVHNILLLSFSATMSEIFGGGSACTTAKWNCSKGELRSSEVGIWRDLASSG